jgi:calcium-activated chloride channel regulator 4
MKMSGESIRPRTVFILDISGSMSGMKLETLHLSASRLIEDISDRDYVGIVLFWDQNNIEHSVVQITDRSVRNSLLSKLPKTVRGSTNIGDGLLTGLQALRESRLSTEGATFILVTDGGDDCGDGRYVDRVLPQLLSAKVFNLIFFLYMNTLLDF